MHRLRALGSFEDKVTKELTPKDSVTAPDHDTALQRIQDLVLFEVVVIKELECTAKEVMGKIKDMELQLQTTNKKLEEDHSFHTQVQKLLYNCALEDIKSNIEILIEINDALNVSIPEDFHKDDKLQIAEWSDAYKELVDENKKLVALKEHFKMKMEFKKEKNVDEGAIQTSFDIIMQIMQVIQKQFVDVPLHDIANAVVEKNVKLEEFLDFETKILRLLQSCEKAQILTRVHELTTFRDEVHNVIPDKMKELHTVEEGFKCWSTAYTELLSLKDHFKKGIGIPADDHDTNVKAHFDVWMTTLDEIKKALGVVKLTECAAAITEIATEFGTTAITQGVFALRGWKEDCRLLGVTVKQYEDDAKKAVIQTGDGATEAAALDLLKSEKLTVETTLLSCQRELAVSRKTCEIGNEKIKLLDETKVLLQDVVRDGEKKKLKW